MTSKPRMVNNIYEIKIGEFFIEDCCNFVFECIGHYRRDGYYPMVKGKIVGFQQEPYPDNRLGEEHEFGFDKSGNYHGQGGQPLIVLPPEEFILVSSIEQFVTEVFSEDGEVAGT